MTTIIEQLEQEQKKAVTKGRQDLMRQIKKLIHIDGYGYSHPFGYNGEKMDIYCVMNIDKWEQLEKQEGIK